MMKTEKRRMRIHIVVDKRRRKACKERGTEYTL